MKYRIRRFKSGGGKSASKHRTIDELINIFLGFCYKYEYNSIGLWRNRNTIGHEYNDEIRKDVFRLSDALNEYNASVDDSNKYLINSYMDESLELTPISFQTLFVDNHDNVDYALQLSSIDFDLNAVGVDRNGNIVNLLEYAETYLKREIEIRDELVEVIRHVHEENINPNVRHWIDTANDEIINYEWKIDVLRALYAIKDAKFKESKRQKESSNYKLANIPDDISNELAKFQFGGTKPPIPFGFGSPDESRAKLEQLRKEAAQAQEEKKEYYLTPDGLSHAEAEGKRDAIKQRKRTTYLNRRRLEREDVRALEAAAPRQSSRAAPEAVGPVPNPPTIHTPPENPPPDVDACLALAQKTNRNDWYTFSPTCQNLNRKQRRELGRKLSKLQSTFKQNIERKKLDKKRKKLDKLIEESKEKYQSDFENKRIFPGSFGKSNIFYNDSPGNIPSGIRKTKRHNTPEDEIKLLRLSKAFGEPERKIEKRGPFTYIYKGAPQTRDSSISDTALKPRKSKPQNVDELDKFYIEDMELYKKIREQEREIEDKEGLLDWEDEEKVQEEDFPLLTSDDGAEILEASMRHRMSRGGAGKKHKKRMPYRRFGGASADGDLFDALENNDLEQMRVAIESGANVNVQNHRGTSPLISLAKGYYYPNIEMVDLLLTNNADPNLQDRGGETALHWAAARGYLEIVKKLLESENIDINITNIDGRNALHSIFDDEEELFDLEHVEPIIKLLIEKGININETDISGKTALHLAAEQNHGGAVGILLRAGADENIKIYDYHPAGQTAYELAENKKNRVELDRHNSLGEIIPGGDLVERLRITQIEHNSVRVVITVGEEERFLEIPRNILVDTDHNLWTYEPLALNAFHEFHREKAQAYLAERGQAGITASYLAEEAKKKDSILNSLPHDLEKRISKMLGGHRSNRKKFFKELKGRNSHVKRIISEKYGEDVELAEENTHLDSRGHYVYKLKFKGDVTNNEWVYIGGLTIANTPMNEDWIPIANKKIINDISNKLDVLGIPQVQNFQPKKNSPKKQSKDIGSLQKFKFLETGDRINSDEPDEIKQQEPDESEEEPDEIDYLELCAKRKQDRLDAETHRLYVEYQLDWENQKKHDEREDKSRASKLKRKKGRKQRKKDFQDSLADAMRTMNIDDDEDDVQTDFQGVAGIDYSAEESKSMEPPNPIPEPHTTHSSVDLAKLRNQDLKSASNRYSDAAKQKTKSEKKTRKKTRKKEKKWYRRAEAAEEARVKREREREEARVAREREREEERERDAAVERSHREAAQERSRRRRSSLEYEIRLREKQLAEAAARRRETSAKEASARVRGASEEETRQAKAQLQQAIAQFDQAEARVQRLKNNAPRERTPRVDGGAYNKTLKEIQEQDDEIYHRTDGGGQIFSSNKKDYELEFLNNELSKTRKRYNKYGKLLAVNKLIPKNVDNDIWDYAMEKYKFFKKNYYEPNNVLELAVNHMEWLGNWIDEETLVTMIKVFNILSVFPPNIIHYANSDSVLEIKQSIEYALRDNSTPEKVLIALLRSQAFLIEYYFFMLNHGVSRDRRFYFTINKLNSIFTEIYKEDNYELSLYETDSVNPFNSYYNKIETKHIIESIAFYKEIAIESLKIISEFFEVHHENVFAHLLKEVEKNDEEGEKEDRRKMYKLTKRRKNIPSHWSKHYNKNKIVLPEDIEDKIDENLL